VAGAVASDDPADGATEWVSMRAAAARLGVSQDTVRRRLKRRELVGRQEPTPQGFIWMVELPVELPLSIEGRDVPAADWAAGAAGEAAGLQQLVDELRDQNALLRDQLEERTREVRELHERLLPARQPVQQPARLAPQQERSQERSRGNALLPQRWEHLGVTVFNGRVKDVDGSEARPNYDQRTGCWQYFALLGDQGWELVGVDGMSFYVFKRPKAA
jgi:hypothetical protein